jgi:hypothetical protein
MKLQGVALAGLSHPAWGEGDELAVDEYGGIDRFQPQS